MLISGALLASLLAVAQTPVADTGQVLRNKKGHEILPKKGDIALGFNTIPVIDLLLSNLHPASAYNSAANVVQYTGNSNNQVVGKYYLDAKTAIRVRFGINTLSGTITNRVQDAAVMHQATFGTQNDISAASLIKVEDKLTFYKNNILLSVGYEKRRGYRRLQGFYGAELAVGTTGSRQSATYGNNFSSEYPVEYTDNFNSLTTATQNPTGSGRVAVRQISAKNTGGLRIGLRGFIGIEYFIFAKISIAAEYGWGYSVLTRRKATSKQEVYVNGQNGPEVITETVDNDSKQVTKGFSVDNNNGSIFSMNNTLGGNTALNGGAGALTLIFHF